MGRLFKYIFLPNIPLSTDTRNENAGKTQHRLSCAKLRASFPFNVLILWQTLSIFDALSQVNILRSSGRKY